jgi:hypothetical protein
MRSSTLAVPRFAHGRTWRPNDAPCRVCRALAAGFIAQRRHSMSKRAKERVQQFDSMERIVSLKDLDDEELVKVLGAQPRGGRTADGASVCRSPRWGGRPARRRRAMTGWAGCRRVAS